MAGWTYGEFSSYALLDTYGALTDLTPEVPGTPGLSVAVPARSTFKRE